MQVPRDRSDGVPVYKVHKGKRSMRMAAGSKASRGSVCRVSAAQHPSVEPDVTKQDVEPPQSQHEDCLALAQDDDELELTQQQDDPELALHHADDSEQRLDKSQQQQEQRQNIAAPTASAEVSAIQQLQQPASVSVGVSGSAAAVRKDPLCLRIRPLDGPTKRLMHNAGCTVLLEMPNNK